MGEVLRGIGIGVGVVVAPMVRMGHPPSLPAASSPVADRAAEVERAMEALAAVAADLEARSIAAGDPTATEILDALGMIAADPVLGDDVEATVDADTDAAHALHLVFDRYRAMLADAGGYLAERAQDLGDLRDRAIAVVLGLPMPGVPDPGHPFVLVATDLGPADTVGIDPGRVLALVTEQGGPTSHTAIVARSLGLPCVVACPGAMELPDGTLVGVDAEAGVVETGLDAEQADAWGRRAEAVAAELAAPIDPDHRAAGHTVDLLVNVGSATDLDGLAGRSVDAGADAGSDRPGADAGAGAGSTGSDKPDAGGEATGVAYDGVGLFRTELLFLDRSEPPTFDEQRHAYRAVLEAAAGRKVVVRTLDAGADKPLPFLAQALAPGPNPALGVRGLRVAHQMPDLLVVQLEALAAAVADVDGADAWVMAPMVATAEEADWFVGHARGAGLATAGVMVEVPAAALRIADVLAVADFVSLGTNDLAQYTLAADRMEGALWNLLDPWQPALLELIARCAQAGLDLGKPVGVCGEAAADPTLAPVLAGLGVTSLSMAARALPLVRRALAARTPDDCRTLATQVLQAPTPQAARTLAR